MDVKRQKSGGDRQLSLFDDRAALSRHGAGGEGGTGPAACEVSQSTTALDPARALTACLMEEVCERDNLNRAYARVKANRSAPGVDGMTVGELARWLNGSTGSACAASNVTTLRCNTERNRRIR